MPIPYRDSRRAALAAALALALAAPVCKSHAQTNLGDPVDVSLAIVDGTTGGPGTLERLTIEYLTARPNLVLDVEPAGSSVVLPAVPLKDVGEYVLTAWKDGVPYYFRRRGRELMDGAQTLTVYAAGADRGAARITGMNVVLRREESLLHVEFLLQVKNDSNPPAAIVGTPGSFGLALPADLQDVAAEYHRALDPTPVATAREGGLLQLAVPLVPGPNRVRLTGVLPWRESMDVTIGSDLPVDAWSLLVSPEWAEVTSLELEPDPDTPTPGFKRFVGPALSADRTLSVRLNSGQGQAGAADSLFTQPNQDQPAPEAPGHRKRPFLPLPILLGVAFVLLLLVMRRRRT